MKFDAFKAFKRSTHQLLAICVLPLAACVPSLMPLTIQMAENPERVANLSTAELCQTIRISENSADWSESDKKAAYDLLRKRGFSKRDADLISDKGEYYGTGMTYKGLVCSTGTPTRVNKSFYQYSGHNWQVVLGDHSDFVYLRGNGTESGMKVTSWN